MLSEKQHNETVTTGIKISIQRVRYSILCKQTKVEELKKDLDILLKYNEENEDFDFEEVKQILNK